MLVTASHVGKSGVVPLLDSASIPPAKITKPLSVPLVNSAPAAMRLAFIPPAAPGVEDEPVVSVHFGTVGSNTSAELLVVIATGVDGVATHGPDAPVRPPATRTLPLGSLLILGSSPGTFIGTVWLNVAVAGLKMNACGEDCPRNTM